MLQDNAKGRNDLEEWQKAIKKNIFDIDPDFSHSIQQYLNNNGSQLQKDLYSFADKIVNELDPLVIENNLSVNLPRIEHYDGIGQQVEQIVHHPNYEQAGNIIYSSGLLERMSNPGGLLEALVFMFLSSQAGEAGHNCPLACSAGIIRIFQKIPNFPKKRFYLEKLIETSYTDNFTGAQFLTEIQGGSDVGLNTTQAYQDETGAWRITGEKWFCSNADAELILLTARFDKETHGTKGLGLFLVPARLDTGERNHYTMRRLKDKIGTRSMASAEMDFKGAYAIPMTPSGEGFKMVMENVLHISRLFNTVCVLGMARRAFHIAQAYAMHRIAFGNPIIKYPLVKENLARIKAENTALLASIFATTYMQDAYDTGKISDENSKLLLRLLANLNKYISSLWSVEHIHHCLDVLAGNGAIESFSIIPRLFRDSIVCENWEGTHNVLRMQILRDIGRYKIDELFINNIESTISKIPSSNLSLLKIKDKLQKLKLDLILLKNSPEELQSLQIRIIVDQMALLFSAIHLLLEALDQTQNGNSSKQYCLEYFLLLHFDSREKLIDHQYLDLISRVLDRAITQT